MPILTNNKKSTRNAELIGMTHDPEQQKGRKMFEEIIEFDQEKIEANNYDIDKINAYLDELHDVKEIRKKAEGHYVGTTCSTELARFGAAIMACQESKWFRKIIKKWEFWENGKLEEDVLKTTEEEEKKRGRKLYE